MAYEIDQSKCIQCGDCAESCPVEAILEEDGKYTIDADACLSCGVCTGSCPQEAISEE